MNHRREFLVALSACALAWTGAVRAQVPAQVRRVGFLTPRSPSDSKLWLQAFQHGLRDRGWVEGENISIEYRFAQGKLDRLPDLAAELLGLKVEVVVVQSSWAVDAVQQVSKALPIVMAVVGDPVGTGIVQSLARPGGNITGLTEMIPELSGKRLELLKEMIPNLSRVAVLWNPQRPTSERGWNEIQRPARHLGIQLHSVERSPKDFDTAFEDARRAHAGALVIMTGVVSGRNLKRVADLATKSRMPSIFYVKQFVELGGLASYAPDRSDLYRRAATFVDKILKGAKPADLPVEQPIRFELVVNMKTAKALGLTIPQTVLVQATRLIE